MVSFRPLYHHRQYNPYPVTSSYLSLVMPLANATQYDNDAFGNPPGTENLNRTNDIVSCSSEATSHTILETPFTSAHFPPGNPSNVGYLHSPNPYPGPGYSGYVYPQGGWASTWPVSAVYGQSQLPIMPSTPVHPSPYSAGPQLASLEARTSALQPPSFRKNWDTVITGFFKKAGLSQALRGFEADMIVMNSEWESTTIPIALECLRKDLMVNVTCSIDPVILILPPF